MIGRNRFFREICEGAHKSASPPRAARRLRRSFLVSALAVLAVGVLAFLAFVAGEARARAEAQRQRFDSMVRGLNGALASLQQPTGRENARADDDGQAAPKGKAEEKSDETGDKDKPKKEAGDDDEDDSETHWKDLVERLGRELRPVREEARRALERSLGEIHETLRKEGTTPEELRDALNRSLDELWRSFTSGGPVPRELGEAADRAREDLRESARGLRQRMERPGQLFAEELERLMEQSRPDRPETLDEFRARRRRMWEEVRRRWGQSAEQSRERARMRQRRDRDRDRDRDRAEERDWPELGRVPRGALERERMRVRTLKDALERANRRLEEMERRSREPDAARPDRGDPGPRRERPSAGSDNEQRLRDLETKMEQLLKELRELKDQR